MGRVLKKRKVAHKDEDQEMEASEDVKEEQQGTSAPQADEDEDESSEGSTDEESEDELMKDDVGDAETLDFDFEALPLHSNDKEGIINMLTQMFLRADVDVDGLAESLIRRSPFGCVFLPAEENADDGIENVVYGVLSMIQLGSNEKYEKDVWSLLKTRAKKYAVDKKMNTLLEKLSSSEESRVGLLVNERLLHFPAAIAIPAFSSLRSDLANGGKVYNFTEVIVIMKVRVADVNPEAKLQAAGGSGSQKKGGKRKLGKAAKKRALAAASAEAEIIFDNPEEELLFSGKADFDYFQYPVQSDVEKDSKFNAVVVNGVTFRPYRRVCVLSRKVFEDFIDAVAASQGF